MTDVEKLQPKAVSNVDGQPNLPGLPNQESNQVVFDIADGMFKLMEMVHTSPVLTTDDKDKFSRVMAMYTSFVKDNLGAAPGESVKRDERPDILPQEAGVREVEQAL